MTVRANKPAFSIREKLKELERPIGLKGSELMRAETAQEAGALLGVGRRNTVINGDFRIAQRATDTGTVSLITNETYPTVDRWSNYTYNNSGTFTPQYRMRKYNDHPVSGAQGYCLRYDCISADTPATDIDFLTVYQKFEADNTINFYGNYLSLSFWVKSNKTGPYTVQFRANGGTSGGQTPNSMWKYYVNNPDVWEYKTILIQPQTLALMSAGNGHSYSLFFHLASGQNSNHDANIANLENKWAAYSSNGVAFTDQSNLMSNAGNYWQVTNVQLEVGKNATEFEHRSYGEELALCQRYYQKSYPTEVTPGTNVSASLGFAGMEGRTGMSNVSSNGEHFRGAKLFPSMRTTPNITIYDRVGNSGKITGTKYLTADYDNITASVQNVCATGFQAKCINVGDFGGISFHYTADAEL